MTKLKGDVAQASEESRSRKYSNISETSPFCAFISFSKKSNPSTAYPQRLLNFLSMPIQARMTWLTRSSNTTVQHFILYTIVHYCTLPKWAEAQWVIESLRAKAEKSSNFRSMSVEMTWLCSKPLVLVVQEQSHWPTINYHLTLCSSSALLPCTSRLVSIAIHQESLTNYWLSPPHCVPQLFLTAWTRASWFCQ